MSAPSTKKTVAQNEAGGQTCFVGIDELATNAKSTGFPSVHTEAGHGNGLKSMNQRQLLEPLDFSGRSHQYQREPDWKARYYFILGGICLTGGIVVAILSIIYQFYLTLLLVFVFLAVGYHLSLMATPQLHHFFLSRVGNFKIGLFGVTASMDQAPKCLKTAATHGMPREPIPAVPQPLATNAKRKPKQWNQCPKPLDVPCESDSFD